MNAQSKHQNHSNVAEMLELPNEKFKTTIINMLRALIEKAANTQEQVGNISRKR